MKKIVVCLMAIMLVSGLSSCSLGGNREINFQGITMEIPSAWKAEKETLSDDYAIYEKLNFKGHDYRLVLTDTFGLMETYGNMKAAGAFFKEVTEDNSSYSGVSDPVAGKFADKYNMHTIDCMYHALNPMENDGESDYPCKIVRIYMGKHDVEMEFSAKDGDFKAFEEALANAACE